MEATKLTGTLEEQTLPKDARQIHSVLTTARLSFVLMLLALFASTYLYADKTKVIKMDKGGLFYAGNVLKNKPNGKGRLYIQLDKDAIPLEIEGTFSNNIIRNGRYSNTVMGDWGVEKAQSFTFDSLQYSFDKKTQNLKMDIYGVSPDGNSKLINPSCVHIEYLFFQNNLRNEESWRVSDQPSLFTVEVSGRDNSGFYSYHCKSSFIKGELIERLNKDKGYFFEPISVKDCSLENINRSITMTYDKGVTVSYDGTEFFSEKGNSYVSGTYDKYGELSKLKLTLNSSTKETAELTYEGRDWEGNITFSDGGKFSGQIKFVSPSRFGVNLLTSDYVITPRDFYNGTYITSDNFKIVYSSGAADSIDMFGHNIKAYKVSNCNESGGPYIEHRTASNDIVEDDRYDLKKFVNEGVKTSRCNSKADLDNLFSDEYFYREPISVKLNESANTLTFERKSQEQSINSSTGDYYINVRENLCLTYPRSLISIRNENYYGRDFYSVPTMEIERLPIRISNKRKYDLVWVFKISKFTDDELLGKTTRLYLIDHDTLEILADLSYSLKSDNTAFKKTTTKKYTRKRRRPANWNKL